MKKYFSYPFDETIKKRLLDYYNDPSITQHAKQQKKSEIKFLRIIDLIDLSSQDIVLDVGCSEGNLLKKISPFIFKGVGIDIVSSVIEHNKRDNNDPKLSYQIFDGVSMSDVPEKFDKIFLIDVLEHCFEPDKLIKEISEKLKDDGKLIIEVPFSGWLAELITKKYHQGHLRYYDSEYLKDYLKRFNYKTEKIKVSNSVPLAGLFLKFKPLWSILNLLVNLIPSKYYPYFGEILVVASKNNL